MKQTSSLIVGAAIALLVMILSVATSGGEVPVRYPEVTSHRMFVLRSLDGKEIGKGELEETTEGRLVTSKLTLNFKNSSLYQETAQFTQDGTFHVSKFHMSESGPSFKDAMEMTIDVANGTVEVHADEQNSVAEKQRDWSEHIHLPQDLANGIVPLVARNMPAAAGKTTVSMIVATPSPKLVHVTISPTALQKFRFDGSRLEATRYAVQVDLSGFTGTLVEMAGRQPAPSFVWMLRGKVPSFLMAQEAFLGGPVCRIELARPLTAGGNKEGS